MTIQELRAQIAAIRPMLKSTTDWAALSETTQRDYQQKHAALTGRLPMDAAKCKRSYYGMRAAYLHMESRALRSDLNALDKWTKQAMAANNNDLHGLEQAYMIEMQRLGIDKRIPDLDNRPTAYSFRHAFASELKAANGEDSADTAAALGHASTKTQQGYGYSKSSGGGLSCHAKASDPIRTPHKTRKQAMGQKIKIKVAAMPSPNAPKAKMPSPMDKFKLPRAPAPRF